MKYELSRHATSQTIQLQSIGHVIGEPAKNIKKGDFLMWNFGSQSEVLEIIKETKSFVTIKVKSGDYIGERKFGKERLVCILKKS